MPTEVAREGLRGASTRHMPDLNIIFETPSPELKWS
jgi:hypothetical protein